MRRLFLRSVSDTGHPGCGEVSPTGMPRGPRACPRGFTLVELLVAMAILVTVSASTVLIFRSITRAWRTGELRSQQYQQARLLFDLFERELSSCVSNPRYPLLGVPASGTSPLHDGMAVKDEVMFVGMLPGRTGLVERGYWVTADGDLMCHDDESGDGDYATGTGELCGRDISEFRVAYFDGSEWTDRWDLHPLGQLPKAVWIILSIGQRRTERFETVIHVPAS